MLNRKQRRTLNRLERILKPMEDKKEALVKQFQVIAQQCLDLGINEMACKLKLLDIQRQLEALQKAESKVKADAGIPAFAKTTDAQAVNAPEASQPTALEASSEVPQAQADQASPIDA